MTLGKFASIAVFFFCVLYAPCSFAALSLSVNPEDGSNSLRLEQPLGVQKTKQIRVRITSTDGKHYQVFQRLLEPIVNEKGESLDMQAIQTATISNSNASGTLYTQNVDRLSMGDQLLYSSGQGGESDGFTVAYSVQPGYPKAAGNFMGRLIFTVRSSEEPSQGQAEVNIYLQSTSQWKADVQGGRSATLVRVNDTDTTEQTADFVKISFAGNSGGEVRIYQELSVVPQNADGQEFQPEGLLFYGSGRTDGLRAQTPAALEANRQLLYSGHNPEDNFLVYYLMDPRLVSLQEPGEYGGKLKYTVETDKGPQEYSIDLQCRIQPVFNMDVSVPPEGVSFPHVLATEPPQEKEVTVTVHSNLHKPYQVVQDLQSLMTNEKGKEIDKEYFTFRVDVPPGQKGKTKYADFAPVAAGEYPIFYSDAKGSPATFKVVYKLQGYNQMNAGNYSAPIRFSLNQN